MKKILSILCILALVFSLAACGSSTSADSIYGKVTAIDGSIVTVQLGEMSEQGGAPSGQAPSDGQQPPEKPDGDTSGSDTSSNSQQPPEMPSGEAPSGQAPSDNQQPPEKPDGDTSGSDTASNGQQPPEMPNGQAPSGGFTASGETASYDLTDAVITKNDSEAALSDIQEGDILQITLDKSGNATAVTIMSMAGGFGGSSNVEQGSSANTIDEDGTYTDKTYTSTGDDENALRVDGAEVTLESVTINKDGGATSNTENGDFYGVNASFLATDGATVTIKNATVTSDAQNGNGIFSYGSGTTVNVSDTTITTSKDNSGGIQTTGGATTNASNLTVTTAGNSSAAIRSDRGGGTVKVDGGTYTSNGYNSPAVYSTADITVANAELTANHSEALVIEGQNSITLKDCDVVGNMSDTKGTSSSENVHNVMIYQSMSGDAEVGESTFSMTGGSLTAKNGDMFYITNTDCSIRLSGVSLKNLDSDAYLMNICGNSASRGWGTAGANGANVNFTASKQTLQGDIIVDTISTLNMTLAKSSSFTGSINIVNNAAGGIAVSDNAVITVESGSTWNLTGNCTITSLSNNGTINFNGYTITLADGTVLKG